MVMQRGAIWWANLPAPSGYRPVVLITRNSAIVKRDVVTVAIVTTQERTLPVELKVGIEQGLPKPSVINCDVLLTVSKSRLKQYVSTLSDAKIKELNHTLVFALGLD